DDHAHAEIAHAFAADHQVEAVLDAEVAAEVPDLPGHTRLRAGKDGHGAVDGELGFGVHAQVGLQEEVGAEGGTAGAAHVELGHELDLAAGGLDRDAAAEGPLAGVVLAAGTAGRNVGADLRHHRLAAAAVQAQ